MLVTSITEGVGRPEGRRPARWRRRKLLMDIRPDMLFDAVVPLPADGGRDRRADPDSPAQVAGDTGLLAGICPALRASAIEPVETLRR